MKICILYWWMLPYNLIIRFYDRIQHVIIMDFELIQFYLNKFVAYKSTYTQLLQELACGLPHGWLKTFGSLD